jgi:hypothetical protein
MRSLSSLLKNGILLCAATFALAANAQVSVLTQHNDNQRTGANLQETILNATNVTPGNFGKLYSRPVDGEVYAQPLIISGVDVPGKGRRNILLVATMANTLYAFDADNPLEVAPFWKVNFGPPIPQGDVQCCCLDISTQIGILSTPVVDVATNTVYLASRNKTGFFQYRQWLHALDIRTGQQTGNSPRRLNAALGNRIFDGKAQNQRPAITLHKGFVIVAWSSHNDCGNYTGWVMSYDAKTLQQRGVFATTPTGALGGIWMSGQGLAVDANGDLHLVVGNGTFDANTGGPNLGCSYIKLKLSNTGALTVGDFFTPFNVDALNAADADLGVGGVLAIPGTNYVAGGSKHGVLYLLDANKMGKYQAGSDSNAKQAFQAINGHLHGAPIFYDSPTLGPSIYLQSEDDFLKAFKFTGDKFETTPAAFSPTTVPGGMPGAMLSLSANGKTPKSAVIWASHPLQGNANQMVVPGMVRAYDPNSITVDGNGVPRLKELWNSEMNPADSVGKFAKFCPPTVANGKVYMASFGAASDPIGAGQVVVYGIAPQKRPTTPVLHASAGDGFVQLVWNLVPRATAYAVLRSEPGRNFIPISGNALPGFIDANVTNGVPYTYVVVARNGVGDSLPSNPVTATPGLEISIDNDSDAYTLSGDGAQDNFGTETRLIVTANSPNAYTFVQFDLSGLRGRIASAKVRLFGKRAGSTGTSSDSIYEVNDNTWDEETITWANQPALGNKIATTLVGTTARYYEWDVSDVLRRRQAAGETLITFAIKRDSTNADNVADTFNSFEAPQNRPKLAIGTNNYPHYPAGFTSMSDLAFNGAAAPFLNRVRLVDGGLRRAGSVFYKVPVNVSKFTTTFTFRPVTAYTEGLTFTIQRAGVNALGGWGGGLGYGADPDSNMGGFIPRSFAYKFDSFNNQGEGPNSVGAYANGATPTTPAISLQGSGVYFQWEHTYQVTLTYDGTTLSSSILDLTTRRTFTSARPVNITNILGGASSAYVGFTSSTGGLESRMEVLSWTMAPLP